MKGEKTMKTRVIYFIINTATEETICTTAKEETAHWIVENYPELCEVRKSEY